MRNAIGLAYSYADRLIFYSDIQAGSINQVHFNGSSDRQLLARLKNTVCNKQERKVCCIPLTTNTDQTGRSDCSEYSYKCGELCTYELFDCSCGNSTLSKESSQYEYCCIPSGDTCSGNSENTLTSPTA